VALGVTHMNPLLALFLSIAVSFAVGLILTFSQRGY
jgi:hypothetical protein